MKRLQNLPDEEKRKLLIRLFTKAQKDISEGYVYSKKADEDIVKSIIGLSMEYAGNIDCIGGIVVENLEKTIKIDYRFETIMDDLWNRKLKDIADILFR
jgi:V/A-type H+-transporting ATPase subunit E